MAVISLDFEKPIIELEKKLKEWIEWYNYKRPHQGIGGLTPADRFFGVDKTMREVMEKGTGMVKDALLIDPRRIKDPVYLVGKIGGKEIKIIAKEGNVTLEGLDGVIEKAIKAEEKEVESKKEDVVEGATGGCDEQGEEGRGILRSSEDGAAKEHDGGGKTQDNHDGLEEKENPAGSEQGNGSEPGIGPEMEGQSN